MMDHPPAKKSPSGRETSDNQKERILVLAKGAVMAYLIFLRKGVEVGRRRLAAGLTVGRAGGCAFAVDDALLSRRHCRFERDEDGKWAVVDLGSKNGTRVNGVRVDRAEISEGADVVAGRMRIRIISDEEASAVRSAPALDARPADPFEALSATVSAYDPDGAAAHQRRFNLPTPQPRPRDPAAYAQDDVYGMLSDIASSSWDSIYAGASRPIRRPPRARLGPTGTIMQALESAPLSTPTCVASASASAPASRASSISRPARPVAAAPTHPPSRPASLCAGRIHTLLSLLRAVASMFELMRKRIAPEGAIQLF